MNLPGPFSTSAAHGCGWSARGAENSQPRFDGPDIPYWKMRRSSGKGSTYSVTGKRGWKNTLQPERRPPRGEPERGTNAARSLLDRANLRQRKPAIRPPASAIVQSGAGSRNGQDVP